MTFKKLTELQKKRAKVFRAEQRRALIAARQIEVTLACFAYVASSDFDASAKEVKFTSDCLGTFKVFSGLKLRLFASDLKPTGSSHLAKILSQTKYPPFSQRAFQRQLLTQLLALCVCDGPLVSEEELAVEHIAACLKFPLATFERLKARLVSKEKAKKILEENKNNKPLTIHSYYKVLGCAPTDSLSVVKKSFRKLAAVHHPDKHAAKNPGPREAIKYVRNFQKIQEAYEKILQNFSHSAAD